MVVSEQLLHTLFECFRDFETFFLNYLFEYFRDNGGRFSQLFYMLYPSVFSAQP